MLRIWPEQLNAQLREGLRPCYILSGNEPLLLLESQDVIRQYAREQQFTDVLRITLDQNSDWDVIFGACHSMSLFASRQVLILTLPENGPTTAIAEQLRILTTHLHSDILLILVCNKLNKNQENSQWFKALAHDAVLVPCLSPDQSQLPRWVANRARAMKLELDDAASQLLCYCYEGNLLALSQALERLSLQWPDQKLTLPRVEQAVSDATHFTPFHWIDALLDGKSKRALHILHQLAAEDNEPVILLRVLQRDVLLLLKLHRQMNQTPLRTLFDQNRVWQNRRQLFTTALQRLTAQQIQQSVTVLSRIELKVKQEYGQNVWTEFEMLSLLLCHPPLPEKLYDL